MQRSIQLLTGLAAACLVSAAMAQGNNCARDLTQDELRQVTAETTAMATEFREAFNRMKLDTATSTVSTVGATLVGGSLASEVAASVDGLKHMVLLRDQIEPAAAREAVISRLAVAMKDASNRARKVSMAYGQVSRMAHVKEVQDLAANGMAYADNLSRHWGCQ